MNKIIYLFLGICFSSSVNAGVILQADSVWTDGTPYSAPIENIINQSGLASSYTSGVDDFATFVNNNTANYASGVSLNLGDNSAQLDNFYFNLGAVYTIDALAIWNQYGSASLKTFDIYASSDANFVSTTLLGSYSITDGPFNVQGNIFSFAATTAQYFMIDVTANYGFSQATRINEVAFSSVQTQAVSEPISFALFGLGLLGIVFSRKDRSI